MKKLTIEEIRLHFLSILEEIDRVCRKYDIEYFLAYGTLIGAVRHKGFIPWDDDVDIGMRRTEYEKFVKAWDNENHGDFQLRYEGNTENYLWGYAKIIDSRTAIKGIEMHLPFEYGLFVDVFPFDDASYDNEEEIDEDNKRLLSMYRHYMINAFRYYIPTKKYASLFNWFLCKDKNKSKYFHMKSSDVVREANEYLINYPKDKRIRVTREAGSFPPESYKHYPRSIFYGVKYVPFENLSLPIPIHYDEMLKIQYGDYMTPPPEKERIGQHFTEVILKE